MPSDRSEGLCGLLRGRCSRRPAGRGVLGGPLSEQRFVGDGWKHLAAGVPAPVVVGVDEPGDLAAGLVLGGEALPGQELELEGRVEALGRGVVEPTRPIDWVTWRELQAWAKRSPTYSPPLSVWKITPAMSPPRTAAAMHRAAFASAESWCPPTAKPGSRREPRSSTVARYSLPSSVGISVRSPHHFSLIAPALKSRRTRSGIGSAALSGRVRHRRFRFGGRPARPWRTIESATVLIDTAQPASTRCSQMRGEP